MGTASSGEWIAILLYFALVIGVGVYFFFRDRHQEGEKEYFLGGRSMGGWVADHIILSKALCTHLAFRENSVRKFGLFA